MTSVASCPFTSPRTQGRFDCRNTPMLCSGSRGSIDVHDTVSGATNIAKPEASVRRVSMGPDENSESPAPQEARKGATSTRGIRTMLTT